MLAKGWTEKKYHDRVMRVGSMPIEMLRNLLLESPVSENYRTQWKFSTDLIKDLGMETTR